MKLLKLLNDLVKNDDSLINDGAFVRSFVRNSTDLIDHLLNHLEKADFKVSQEFQLRKCVLSILLRVFQLQPDLQQKLLIDIEQHRNKINEAIVNLPAKASMLMEELEET